jgi:S1-C subfamily serine protease
MESVRRVLFAFLVFAAAAWLFASWRGGREEYGLLNLLRGEKPDAAAFTAPAAPKLDLEDVQVLAKLNDESAKLAATVLPAVVSVNTKTVIPGRQFRDPFWGRVYREQNRVFPGLGSGAIISKEGHVVTNYHVIDRVTEIQVTTNDKKQYAASVIGADRARDVALLKIESQRKDFPALTFANSEEVKVGQLVFAIGNPFGLSGTVTQGIISARDRLLSDGAMDYLQTDTVINPGNSGGPLVNIRGEIVGVNVAIYRGDQNVESWQGVGLAIPANEVKSIVDEVIRRVASGGVQRGPGFLGLTLSQDLVRIDASISAGGIGVLVEETVPGSAAAAAGLQTGDIITAFSGRRFRSQKELFAMIKAAGAGARVKLQVLRGDETLELEATLAAFPEQP